MSVTSGGVVESRYGYIAGGFTRDDEGYSDSTGEVTVDGAGSKWTISSVESEDGVLYVGKYGSGKLNITNGGVVSCETGYVGYESNSMGKILVSKGKATVSGNSATWTNSKSLKVIGTIDITRGGVVSCGAGAIYNGGQVLIDGYGSKWTNHDDLYVGKGTLNISNRGLASAGRLRVYSLVKMSRGGMLALLGKADNSLTDFLGLMTGYDKLRCWSDSTANWDWIWNATKGEDYTLEFTEEGDLAGYTVLTVGVVPEPSTIGLILTGLVTLMLFRRRR